VAAAAVARKWLKQAYGVQVRGRMSQLGSLAVPLTDWSQVPLNAFFAADASVVPQLEAHMDALRREGDSCGARIEVVADHVPAGWGEPLFDRLDADIAHAMMGINAVKGVEIGAGFASVAQRGSEHGDELTPDGFASNHAGGVLGGISTGQPLVVSMAPPPMCRLWGVTIPAWASAPRRWLRPCCCLSSWTMPCAIVPSAAMCV
jgi:chorismate synthase